MLVNQTFFDRLTNILLRGIISELSIYVVANLTLRDNDHFLLAHNSASMFLDNCFLVVYVNVVHF